MTFDFIDKFWLKMMNDFYEEMRADLTRYGKKLSEALEKDDEPNIKTYLRMVKETRQVIEDISDENMTMEDFARLITSKYQVKTDD